MSDKRELPEVEATHDGGLLVQLEWGERLLTHPEAAKAAHICNNWPHVKELVAELKSKCEGMGEYEWNELFEPVFDELAIVLEGE